MVSGIAHSRVPNVCLQQRHSDCWQLLSNLCADPMGDFRTVSGYSLQRQRNVTPLVTRCHELPLGRHLQSCSGRASHSLGDLNHSRRIRHLQMSGRGRLLKGKRETLHRNMQMSAFEAPWGLLGSAEMAAPGGGPGSRSGSSWGGLTTVFQKWKKWKWHTAEVQKLPIYFDRDGQQLQYAWDGQTLFMEPVDPSAVGGVSIKETKFYPSGMRRICRTLRRTFVPENVRPHYLSYMKWKFLHRVLSSVLQVQCTQAMLQAIGIGARKALPAAASLNWVLKDGLGRLGRFAYSGALGSTFDSNLKGVRFSTSVLFSLSLGLEMLTPYFPSYFLFLATVANVGRSIALAAYLATSSAIHKSFAVGDNLADIAAKGQVQTVVADNLGLAVSCALSTVVRSNKMLEALLLLVVFPILTGLDLFAIYHELQAVHFQTLNKVRLEIIVKSWIKTHTVPSAGEVSTLEGLQFFRIPGQQIMPLRIGALNPSGWKPDEVLSVFGSQSQQPYAIFPDSYSPMPFFRQSGLLLWLRDDFSSKDVITGTLQVEHLRLIASSESFMPSTGDPENKGTVDCIDLHVHRQESTEGRGSPKGLRGSWGMLVEMSRQQAVEGVDSLLAAMKESGWQTEHILLSPDERHPYNLKLKGKS